MLLLGVELFELINLIYKVSVVDDHAAMLNQTNVGQNNNKFYVIQVLTNGSTYWSFNRWGRVGENGQQKVSAFGSNKNGAIADFEKKYAFDSREFLKLIITTFRIISMV